LSTSSALPGASITVNGVGFRASETADVTLNAQMVGSPTVTDNGTFSLAFTVPTMQPGQYAIMATGRASNLSATRPFTVNQPAAALKFSVPQAAPGTSLTVTGTGFTPGETVQFWYNGASLGTSVADTTGVAVMTFTIPTLSPAAYDMTATGETS